MNQWGGTWDQGYDQNWSQWGDDGSGGGYLRSLGCIDACACAPRDAPAPNSITDWLNNIPADVPTPTVLRRPPVLISNRYAAIDSDADTMCVQITDLIKKKRRSSGRQRSTGPRTSLDRRGMQLVAWPTLQALLESRAWFPRTTSRVTLHCRQSASPRIGHVFKLRRTMRRMCSRPPESCWTTPPSKRFATHHWASRDGHCATSAPSPTRPMMMMITMTYSPKTMATTISSRSLQHLSVMAGSR